MDLDAPPPSVTPAAPTPPYKPLALELKNHGMTMRQVRREGDIAMYSKSGGFEVIRIRKHPGGKMFDKTVEPHELYPGDGLFGHYGWYYSGADGRARADAKFDELVAKSKSTAADVIDQTADDVADGTAGEVAESVVDKMLGV